MRFSLIIFLCAISFQASAQWWHIRLKKHDVLPLMRPVKDHSIGRIPVKTKFVTTGVTPLILNQTQYSLEVAEASVMKTVKHNMRFRIYNEASYNFSELAQLYMKLHRLSEAKWYLLQSNKIAREESDDKHTISNLILLSMIKTDLGDKISAQADLIEARDLAHAKGMQEAATEIEKRMQVLEQNKMTAVKPDMKYAEAVTTGKKAL
jgi:hypothetical protein